MKTMLTTIAFISLGLASIGADAPAPAVSIELGPRQAQALPTRSGFNHTGGGNIDVQQSGPDSFVVTMTGVAVAGGCPGKDSVASLAFNLCQDFEISFAKADVKRAKLTIEGRVIGLLRSHNGGGGTATIACPANARIFLCDSIGQGQSLCELTLPGRTASCGENVSVNDKGGPAAVVVPAGKFTLRQEFGVQAFHPKRLLPCKTASAEFAPDPALDPLWISAFEPFHGAQKKDFGFQVIIRASAVD